MPVPRRRDGTPARVLVVDADERLTQLVGAVLDCAGWAVRTALTGARAVDVARRFDPDVVVLDVACAEVDGAALPGLLRGSGGVAILFVTSRDDLADRIADLTESDDGYVTKPFSPEEVLGRLRRLARRSGRLRAMSPIVQVGDLVLDEDAEVVSRAGDRLTLTATEFALLRFLMLHPRRVLSTRQILDRVWNYDFGGRAHVVELYIGYLRKKVDAGREPLIHTVRGAGYVLHPTP